MQQAQYPANRIGLFFLQDQNFDVVITEIGGTVGDIESLPFIEGIRQFQFNNKGDCIHIHLTLVPYLSTSGEFKTKPTQHSVKELRSIGIQPDIIMCRCEKKIDNDSINKISLFCNVNKKTKSTQNMPPDGPISAVLGLFQSLMSNILSNLERRLVESR